MELPLRCDCGRIEGKLVRISRSLNRRVICLCRDCQAFAHYLERTSRILDANGGTEVITFHPADIRITRGGEELACVRLSSDGIYRWYSRCCKTPIGNTAPSAKVPYVGLIHTFIAASPEERTRVLGDVFARINGESGIPPFPPGTSMKTPPRLILQVIQFMATGIFLRRGRPSPFFDEKGKPKAPPILRPDEKYGELMAVVAAAKAHKTGT